MPELRPYQRAAVDAVYAHLRDHDDNPCVVLPTASGKSFVLAQIASDTVARWNGRILILAHVQELLEQNADKIRRLDPNLHVGIYSAGLKSHDTLAPVIVAGIQSVYKRACELGRADLIVVDECHLLAPDLSACGHAQAGGEGMYRSFLSEMKAINPHVRVIGLTATPFRMKSGLICGPDNILNAVCYEAGVKELIRDGYLCPLVTKASREKVDTSALHIRAGEFITGEVEDLMDTDELVESACREIVEHTRTRRSVLVFASGVRHGKRVAACLTGLGQNAATVFGDTLPFEREQVISDFRAGRLKYLVNVQVLTTGFDAPNIDCVAILRPTMSPGLWAQMVGRGFRLHEGKENCLVLDFGGNALRHGPVDALQIEEQGGNGSGEAPAKECPECRSLIAAGYATCPDCGHEFPPPEDEQKHDAKAGTAGVLSGQVSVETYPVEDVCYFVHIKRNAPPGSPRTMRVEYQTGFNHYQSEWICFEHTGWARKKAESWWRRRSRAPVPETAEEAVRLAEDGALAPTLAITVRSVAGEKYERITGYELDEKPACREPGWEDGEEIPVSADRWEGVDDDSIPF